MCVLESEYYPGFQESEYQAKHQLDVLTGGKVHIEGTVDINSSDPPIKNYISNGFTNEKDIFVCLFK